MSSSYSVTPHNMENVNIEYSTKNIPIPLKCECKTQRTLKVEYCLKRMRWKALQIPGKLEGLSKENYEFNSRRCPPSNDKLTDFKDDMTNLIRDINLNSSSLPKSKIYEILYNLTF